MPLPKEQIYTSEDYWNLPEGERAELIGGKFYAMTPPVRIHQDIISGLVRTIGNHVTANKGGCRVYPAPFAVNLDANNKDWVEPDLSVICDKNKLTDQGCSGAPDLVIEVVSPSSRKMDYYIKCGLYAQAGVREYWVVDPARQCTMVHRYEIEDYYPSIIPFDRPIPVGIFEGLSICIADLIE